MSANVTSDETVETRYYNRRIEFDNVGPVLLERNYSHGGKEMLPTIAKAKWSHGNPIEHITVVGPVLRKDRSAGQQLTELEYITPAHSRWGMGAAYYVEAPTWLLEAFQIDTNNEMSK